MIYSMTNIWSQMMLMKHNSLYIIRYQFLRNKDIYLMIYIYVYIYAFIAVFGSCSRLTCPSVYDNWGIWARSWYERLAADILGLKVALTFVQTRRVLFFLSSCGNTTMIKTYLLTWWRHQMETFSALLALCAGNSPVPVNSPHKGQWRGALMFSFIYAWINDWVNNREAGDLRRQDGHYDVIVM